MKQGFFPDMVYNQLYMEYKLPEGTNSTRVVHDLQEIETYLKSRKENNPCYDFCWRNSRTL